MSGEQLATKEPMVGALVGAVREALEPYRPRTLHEAEKLATHIAESGMFAHLGTPSRALVVMAFAAELDIPLTAALRGIQSFDATIGVLADLKVALVMRSPECEYFRCVSTDETQATYETKRRGCEVRRLSFSIEDARRAGLPLEDPESHWYRFPRSMLRHRASSELATLEYPDVVLCMPTGEEVASRFPSAPARAPEPGPAKVVLDADLVVGQPAAANAPPPPPAAPPEVVADLDVVADRLIAECLTATSKAALRALSKRANEAGLKGSARERFLSAHADAVANMGAATAPVAT